MSKKHKKKKKKYLKYIDKSNNDNNNNKISAETIIDDKTTGENTDILKEEEHKHTERINLDVLEKYFIKLVFIITLIFLITPNKILNTISIFLDKILP